MGKEPKVDYSASASSLAAQLESSRQEVAELRARVRTLESRLRAAEIIKRLEAGEDAYSRRKRDGEGVLLDRLALAFLLANYAENAHSSAALHDGRRTTGLRDNSRPSPGSSTHPARRRANELRNDVIQALERWDWAVENHFARPVKPGDDVPKVRCRVGDCPAQDVWVPAWRKIRGGRTIYHERCSTCGTPYPPIEAEEAS